MILFADHIVFDRNMQRNCRKLMSAQVFVANVRYEFSRSRVVCTKQEIKLKVFFLNSHSLLMPHYVNIMLYKW
jgi:hypothetical protein